MNMHTPAPSGEHTPADIAPADRTSADCTPNDPSRSLPALRRRRKPPPALAAPQNSGRLLVRLAPQHTALFRFLLEAYDHTAYFTVLEPKTALLKIIFSPHLEKETRQALAEMSCSLPFELLEWPFGSRPQGRKNALR